MQTLANILAGVPADPSQVNPGLSPLITQALINRQLASGMTNPMGGNSPYQPAPGQGMPGAGQNTGIGSMGATALPMIGALGM